jgi:ribosome-binding factor A
MKQNQNSRRMAQQAQEKLGYILLFEMSDPELELVTCTGCEVSIDKSVVVAYMSCASSRYEEVESALARAKGRIRSLLGRALGWRVTPELRFRIDTTADEAERIGRALTQVPETMAVAKDADGYPVVPGDEDQDEATMEGAAC